LKTREIICEYQPIIVHQPVNTQQLRSNAVANDSVTIDAFSRKWLKNIGENKKFFGNFKDKSLGNLFGKYLYQPAIVAGSGGSLKFNADKLKDRGTIPLLSCLHNFHFLEDNGVPADYYVSLDAGEIVLEEVSEGGAKSEDEYWALTKDRTLIAFIGSDPRLFQKWQGQIYLFNAPVPDKDYEDAVDAIEKFHCMVSNGGNVLGACMYIAKAFFGCSATVFVGSDFSFGYDRKFHAWNSKYDAKMGHCIPLVDVYGNKVPSWQSYANFKSWFEWVSVQIPGIYINCSEGGCLGSYPDGNIHTIKQMELEKCLDMFNMSRHMKEQAMDPENAQKKILF
jgi:hypothetical protein